MSKTQHCEHGVFLSIYKIGLLLKGDPGSGKSTLALELIERGHHFISDDVVHFDLEADADDHEQNNLIGKSPYILQDLLTVRDLGVINISQFFSPERCVAQHSLDLVIQLVDDDQPLQTGLTGIQSQVEILGQTIPLQMIHAHPKRNLAVIVETAIKNYILYKNNQQAVTLLEKRQQEYIVKTS